MTTFDWEVRRDALMADLEAALADAEYHENIGATALARDDKATADEHFAKADTMRALVRRLNASIQVCVEGHEDEAEAAKDAKRAEMLEVAKAALNERMKAGVRMDELLIRFNEVFSIYTKAGDDYRQARLQAGGVRVPASLVEVEAGLDAGIHASAPDLARALGVTPIYGGPGKTFAAQSEALSHEH
jgi:hypothetical protein